jgi:hypothetical protein
VTNSVPVLPFISGLLGLAFAVKIIILNHIVSARYLQVNVLARLSLSVIVTFAGP